MIPGLSVFVFQELGWFPVRVAFGDGLRLPGWISTPKTLLFAAVCRSNVSRQGASRGLNSKSPAPVPPHRGQECAWGQTRTVASTSVAFYGHK